MLLTGTSTFRRDSWRWINKIRMWFSCACNTLVRCVLMMRTSIWKSRWVLKKMKLIEYKYPIQCVGNLYGGMNQQDDYDDLLFYSLKSSSMAHTSALLIGKTFILHSLPLHWLFFTRLSILLIFIGKEENRRKTLVAWERMTLETNSVHIWPRTIQGSNLGHSGERPALSPLHHPCHPSSSQIRPGPSCSKLN